MDAEFEGIAANLSGKWGRHKLKKIDTGHCVRAMKIAYRQGDVAEYDTPPDKIGRSSESNPQPLLEIEPPTGRAFTKSIAMPR
jgi:hypothetical protein